MELSPELEAYFELCKRIYERLEREGKWEEAIATIRAASERGPSSRSSIHRTGERLWTETQTAAQPSRRLCLDHGIWQCDLHRHRD